MAVYYSFFPFLIYNVHGDANKLVLLVSKRVQTKSVCVKMLVHKNKVVYLLGYAMERSAIQHQSHDWVQ